jgi:hypothetical protein
MRVSIHQPEHFPYMGFFQKMNSVDVFVILDNVKFTKNYYQNRNKMKTNAGQDLWFTVPVEKNADSKMIKDVMASNDPHWRRKLIRTIQDNLKFDASEIYKHEKLVDINMSSILWSMEKLKIETKLVMSSDLNVHGSSSELLVNIIKNLGGSTYVSGPMGRNYLDMNLFEGINVEFFEPKVDNHYSSLYNILSK